MSKGRSCKVREKRRLSLRRGGILGRTDIAPTTRREIQQGSLEQSTHRLSILCSENQYIGCWRKSRTSHTLSGRIRWWGSPRGTIRTFIANTTRTTDIPRRIAEPLKLSGPASPRRKAEAPSARFQWLSRLDPSGTPERYCPKAICRDDQCNLGCVRISVLKSYCMMVCMLLCMTLCMT